MLAILCVHKGLIYLYAIWVICILPPQLMTVDRAAIEYVVLTVVWSVIVKVNFVGLLLQRGMGASGALLLIMEGESCWNIF